MKYLFEVKIRDGHTAEEYADAWVRASELIQQAPGALGTELHRKIDDPKTLIAIAHWDSKASRDVMEAQPAPKVKEIIKSAAPFCEIHVIGEFEEPEWVVMPSGQKQDHD
ncbi:antibiotic biosynthesis monooxygenase [Halomonas sp. KAO]|uniref:antibiotic biosynthesis monooxygenase family protein n=1 Tax=Halomonas sp. KAO TaxID=2783858 RepID=UPI00189DBDE1|nr:antibiotic biosynthesis monooxygenase [Halomonas sp. KAO]MBF7052697.1 antibiotic biosynthesis monooxygenase [Halomonas sp. KAO]